MPSSDPQTPTAEAETANPRQSSPVIENKSKEDIQPENEVSLRRLLITATSIYLCAFLVGLDFNVIATAVPVITTRFDSIGHVGWYGSAFYMTLCASQPLAGKTYTLFSKKVNFMGWLFLFEVGSLICAVAPSSEALIAGRAVAGFGASGVFAGGFAIVTSVLPLHKRPVWLAAFSGVFAIASIVGPVIGGGLTQHVSWRWCFYINLPIGAFGAALLFIVYHPKPAATENATLKEKIKGLDGLGFTLFAAAIVMLLLALQWGGTEYAWDSSVVIGLFVGFALVLGLFIAWQMYMQDNALIPPKLFDDRNVWLICASTVFVNGPFQTLVYWLPIWFQAVQGVSPTASGVRYLPSVISDVLAGFVGAGMVTKLGIWNPFLLFAEAMVCIGGGLLTTLEPSTGDGKWIGYQIFGGMGYALATNLAHLGVQASLPDDLVPMGATTVLMVISTSCAVFLAIGQAVFDDRLTENLSAVLDPALVQRVVSVGATQLREVVDARELPAAIQAYSDSTTQVFYIPAVAPVISFILVAFCRWTRIKKPEEQNADVDEKPQV